MKRIGKLGTTSPMTGLYNAEFVDYRSATIAEDFRLFVASPTFVEPGEKYPVNYVLNANGTSGLVMETARLLEPGENLATFVVGIGCAVDYGFAGALFKRFRDLSPTKGGELEDMKRRWTAAFAGPVTSGGGPLFLQFLREEVKPAIEAAYPVDPEDANIGGASIAGLFLTWTLLTQPETCLRYIIISPSVWWNQEEVWQWE